MRKGYVYILGNRGRTAFYIGVTSSLARRMRLHQEGSGSAFARRYKMKGLLYYEEHPTVAGAIRREKQLKNWHREWKINLVRAANPEMEDLTGEVRS